MQVLREELREAQKQLAQFPALGRSPCCLLPISARGRLLAAHALRLARQQKLDLRELVLKRHLLLYAHGDKRVFFIAIKHTDQAEFSV